MEAYNSRRFSGFSDGPSSFTFRSNVNTRMLPRHPETPILSRSNDISKDLKTPVLSAFRGRNQKFEMKQYPQGSSYSYDEGYASAMEPMDYDVCGMMDDTCFDTQDTMTNGSIYDKTMHNHHTPNRKQEESSLRSRNISGPKKDLHYLINSSKESQHGNLINNSKEIEHVRFDVDQMKRSNARQSVLVTGTPKGLGYKLEEKEKKSRGFGTSLMNVPRRYPKWSTAPTSKEFQLDKSNCNFPVFFTVTIEKLLSWPKILSGGRAIFELYGILEKVTDGEIVMSKNIFLKSEKMKSGLGCTFYEIDRSLPNLVIGQWQRCIILVRHDNEYQCLKIRPATPLELKNLDVMVNMSSKSKAVLLKSMSG